MIRVINVRAGKVKITATIKTPSYLTRLESERVRDALADRLQAAAANLPLIGIPANRVRVQ